ncbi:MAG: hypothetical protein JNL88_10185 [Bacteroidia bacterium]|nr:hypothetical protein [Bacteroidia bacterium]
MKKQLLFPVFAFLAFYHASAQNNFISEYRFNQKIIIADGSPSSPDAYPYIKDLAEGNGKSPRSTSFTIEFEQVLNVITREPRFVYKIESGALRLKGDIRYKGFDVSEYLLPAELKFSLRQKNRNGSFRDFPLTVAVENGRPEKASHNDPDSTGTGFTNYELVNHVFRFRSNNAFEARIKRINEYYSATQSLDRGYLLLQTVYPGNVENFRNNQRNLLEAERVLRSTEQMQFESDLPLGVQDPAKLKEKISIYRNLLAQKRIEMDHIWSTLHLTFFDKGMYFLQRNNMGRAQEYLIWSLEVNPLFAPALLQLAEIDFRRGDLHESTCKADDILYNMPVDPETRSLTIDLLSDVYAAYLERGKSQYKRRNFKKALDEYESAGMICEKYNRVPCTEALYNGIREVKLAIYKEFLDEARDFLVLNDFDRAEDATEAAIRFQQENRKYIADGQEGQAVLKGIQQKRYDYSVMKARKLSDQKMYDAALAEFGYSDSLLSTHQLLEARDIRSAIVNAAKPRAFELLYEGEAYVKSNQLPSARDRYKRAGELMSRHGMNGDKDLQRVSESLRKSIFTQQCLNAQAAFDSLYNVGQDSEPDGNYQEADKAYEKALGVAAANKDCEIFTDSVQSARMGIRPAVTFLDLMDQVKADQQNGRYQAAIDHFQDASRYFQERKVSAFGILHDPDLYRFIREKGNGGLISYAGDWYRERGELESSLNLYKLLLSRNYDARMLEGSLYKLGMRFGERDQKLNPGSSWKLLVKEYTGGEKKMRKFSKGFKAGFKK